jgi:hypothetical protein
MGQKTSCRSGTYINARVVMTEREEQESWLEMLEATRAAIGPSRALEDLSRVGVRFEAAFSCAG